MSKDFVSPSEDQAKVRSTYLARAWHALGDIAGKTGPFLYIDLKHVAINDRCFEAVRNCGIIRLAL